ncbi:MAG TPA: anthranilate synthase component I family protein [Brevundimonas sp.]
MTARRTLAWREPLAVAAGLKGREGALALITGGDGGGRSWVAAEPDRVVIEDTADGALFAALARQGFDAGVVGLAAYDPGARAATGPREGVWPDLMLARYPAMLAFDHDARTVTAFGWGGDAAEAGRQADRAAGWLDLAIDLEAPPAPAAGFPEEAPAQAYVDAVADVVERIAAGDLFQANIARAWSGGLNDGADPFDLFLRLARTKGAAYGAFWRLGGRALVSNSPELFLTLDGSGRLEARPIKGTRARDPDPARDAALAAELVSSAKDRAENLMIVDLMRNDLARVAEPGSVRVEQLFALQTLPTVHHLVSTVAGRARDGVGPAEVLEATFPPGSITGAPKHQAMKVIAAHEPPRGAWCGSLFVLDEAGALTASVLIRTVSFVLEDGRWRWRTLAGAGIVADSDPSAELAETDAKIAAIRQAMTDGQGV